MPRFLNTSATNYFLAELIKSAKDRLILIRAFLKLNDRIKEILMDKGSREAYTRKPKELSASATKCEFHWSGSMPRMMRVRWATARGNKGS